MNRYGPQGWWPSDSPLECILGAILTQNTSWTNVERAIGNLKAGGMILIERLAAIDTPSLAEVIRPSGYFNQKAQKIKNFIRFLGDSYNGNLDEMLASDTEVLRRQLLDVKGIGAETADSILLYAAGKTVFVVDAYTHRILSRHGIIPQETNYEEMQDAFMRALPDEAGIFNEYHALLVRLGKERCRKKSPLCAGCPLEDDPHEIL
ncbi:MAG: endonuclease III domain-containing protein [Deltaproteobacteria bacterium]